MNKMKLVALSVFALSATSVLASCAGSGNKPVSKEDVYLRASAYTINYDEEIKETLYTNDECATIEVENKDSLKYGEQDVVIHVKPKKFFTFRQYNKDDWTAVGLPVRPYVGLGNPVSLYSYPLQENVAWTFEDVSKPIKKEEVFTGFYDEEYKITVKKEYFQRNIVIDYGHFTSLKNHMYVYNSAKYQEILKSKQSLQGDYKDVFELFDGGSSFTAASLGATVTYTFADENAPYTLSGWDKPNIQYNSVKNDDIVGYKHFKVEGIDSKKNRTLLSIYDTTKSEKDQKFMVNILGDGTGKQLIQFFIKWELLAKGPEDGYEPLYEDIQVTFDRPTLTCIDTVKADEGITIYPGDFFMHPSATETAIYKSIKLDEPFKTNDSKKPLSFEHVYSDKPADFDSARHITYSTLFKLEESKKDFFSITIDKNKAFDVDLKYGKTSLITGWRTGEYNPQIGTSADNGERELKFWTYNDVKGGLFWTLVQLNPKDDKSGSRTYGLPDKDLIGKENLYYLYTDSSLSNKESLNIEINYEKAPTLTTFKLSENSQQYGAFEGQSTVVYPCGDYNSVDIKFNPNGEFSATNFDVKVLNEKLEPLQVKTNYSSGDVATIHLESNEPLGKNTFIIDLSIAKTKVALSSATAFPNQLGWLIKDGQPVDSYDLEITGQKEFNFSFLFDEKKYTPDLTNLDDNNNEWNIEVYYNNALIDDVTKSQGVQPLQVDLTVIVPDDVKVAPEGGLFKIEVKYLQFNYKGDGIASFTKMDNQPRCWEYVGRTRSEGYNAMNFRITFNDPIKEISVECENPMCEHADWQPEDEYTAIVIVYFNNYSDPMPNGEIFTFNIFTK